MSRPTQRKGILAAGNWIVDQVKIVDVYPQRETLANIWSQSEGTGGSPYNILVNLSKLDAKFPLAAAGLAPRQDHRVGGFSRGLKQRLALARATLHRPSVLLLDEPFTGLDAAAGTALRERLCRFRADGGTCLLVAHRFDEAEGLIDRLFVLERGRLRGGLLQLQMGRGARCRRLHRVRGGGRVQPRSRAALSRVRPREGRR